MTIATVVGAQWGHEGKGTIAAALCRFADVAWRFQGVAGGHHTIGIHGSEFSLRLLPSGLLTGALGVVGRHCSIDIEILLAETRQLRSMFPDLRNRLLISEAAEVVMEDHPGITVSNVIREPEAFGSSAVEFAAELAACCGDERAVIADLCERGARVVAEGTQGMRLESRFAEQVAGYSTPVNPRTIFDDLGIPEVWWGDTLLVSAPYVVAKDAQVTGVRIPLDAAKGILAAGRETTNGVLPGHAVWADWSWVRACASETGASGLIVTKVDAVAGQPHVTVVDGARTHTREGWTQLHTLRCDPDDALGVYISDIEHRTRMEVACVSNGPGLDQWLWRVLPETVWDAS
jgi:adenylosuccinate synthase